MTSVPLLSLLHLCDSLFPLGGFAHSDGLEAATASGMVRTADDLRAWMRACLHENIGRLEGPSASRAWRAVSCHRFDTIAAIDGEAYALRPSSTSRNASRSMGSRLLKTWQRLYSIEDLSPIAADRLTLPVAFAAVCAASAVDERSTLQSFGYTRLAATISGAMRLMSIGQHEAHAVLTESLAALPAVVDGILARDAAPSAFMPAIDCAAMSQQYVHSRLFRS